MISVPAAAVTSSTTHHRVTRRRRRLIVACILLLLAFALAGLAAWRVLTVKEKLERGQDELNQAVQVLTGGQLSDLNQADLERANAHLRRAEAWLRPARDELGLWEPVLQSLGGDAAAALPLADFALNVAIAGEEAYDAVSPLLQWQQEKVSRPSAIEIGQSELRRVEGLLRAGQAGFLQARTHLQAAIASFSRVDRAALSPGIAQAVARVDKYLPRFDDLGNLLGVLAEAPDLLASLGGLDKQKTYLLLSQNSDELRPAGGFTGSFGVLVVRGGEITAQEYYSTYSPDLQAPSEACPEPNPSWWIQFRYPVWACWDGQWTADFPTLARQVEWFYDGGHNRYAPVDGVIAVDLTGAELLLKALGPVEVPSFGEVITSDNLRDRVYYYSSFPDKPQELHKELLGAVYTAIAQSKLPAITAEQAGSLLDALRQSVSGKHLMFYFNNPQLEALVSRVGADGAIQQTSGDYLYVVDTSMAGKVYGSIERRIEYDARIEPDGTVDGQATINWRYPADAADDDPAIANEAKENNGLPLPLLNMTRIYLPATAQWLETSGSSGPSYFGSEEGRAMVGTRIDVQAGAAGQVRYSYRVLDCVSGATGDPNSVYKLLVQKQPGTRHTTLVVRITLPPGRQLVASSPSGRAVSDGGTTTIEYSTDLESDRAFEVSFK